MARKTLAIIQLLIFMAEETYQKVVLYLLATINKAAMNIMEHVSLLYVGASFWYITRSGIGGSSGNTMSNFLRSHHTDFQSGCTSLSFLFYTF
jgi:hypothetical protein